MKKTGSQENKERLPVSDCQQIALLLKGRMSWKLTLDFIETKQNQTVIRKIRDHLAQGGEINEILLKILPKSLMADYEVLSQLMSVCKALQLSCELAQQRKKVKEQTMKVILYPLIMLVLSLVGLGLFNHFCFPMMISLAESFHQEVRGYRILHAGIRLFLMLISAVVIVMGFLMRFVKVQFYRLSFYLVLIGKGRGEWIRRIKSLDFARYFLCCLKEGCATRSTLTLMQKIKNKPFLKLLSWHVEQGLLQGKSFECALQDKVLDPSLMQLMRCINISEEPVLLLQSYILARQKQIEQRIRMIAMTIQCSAYGIIGVMVILVYQILLMPLSVISGI